MADLQQNVEQIIKNHIEYLTSSRGQKKSSHMNHQYHTLLEELYEQDLDGIIFVNHFGHIEYMNTSFSKYFMLDKYDKSFSNILNINRLPLEIDVRNHRFHMTYPNGHEVALNMTHQLVNFQKSTLLQFRFEDTSIILNSKKELNNALALNDYYMEHVESPMFLVNQDGFIKGVASKFQQLFELSLGDIEGQSIFESLPFDYANEINERLPKASNKLNCNFLYKTENNKIVKVIDTSMYAYKDGLILCHAKDVSDLNTMSSTIEYLNTYDSLTGFFNMAYYEEKLIELDELGFMPLGIYILSIQGLRKVNQKLGYHICDKILIEMALDIKSCISQYEIPCRISGDTFIVFFPNSSRKALNKLVHTMAGHITNYKKSYPDYFLTYAQKPLFLNEKPENLSLLVKSLLL